MRLWYSNWASRLYCDLCVGMCVCVSVEGGGEGGVEGVGGCGGGGGVWRGGIMVNSGQFSLKHILAYFNIESLPQTELLSLTLPQAHYHMIQKLLSISQMLVLSHLPKKLTTNSLDRFRP